MTKKSETGRLFLGVPLGAEPRKKLNGQSWKALERYRGDKIVPSQHWHLTLCFLGNIPEAKYAELINRLNKSDWGREFKLGLKGFGGFPDMDSARVVWAGVETGSEELSKLALELREELTRLGIDYDKKPFVPHLTLVRLKNPKNVHVLEENGKMKQEIKFEVNEFVLYESTPTREPYKELIRIPLKAS